MWNRLQIEDFNQIYVIMVLVIHFVGTENQFQNSVRVEVELTNQTQDIRFYHTNVLLREFGTVEKLHD
jgi:hypothetical protein